MRTIPKLPSVDSSPGLLQDGYRFIINRCEEYETDIFQTQLLLQNTICMRGEAAAELFYDTERFERSGAMPVRVQKTLTGETGVQGLDDAEHKRRKAMFMQLMTPTTLAELRDLMVTAWHQALPGWRAEEEVVLFDAIRKVLLRAVCTWSGVPLAEEEVDAKATTIGHMIDGAGRIGFGHWQARHARDEAEEWAAGLIQQARRGQLSTPAGRALAVIAHHTDAAGNLLEPQVAGVELLNVLRPTVAVGRFITFIALALHEYPAERAKLQQDGTQTELFVQEVRRYYPFFPFAAACVRHDFEWQGYPFPKGTRTLLDLYGTNHHPALWNEPDLFDSEHFRDWEPSPYNFIPQGGGDYYGNHRCAGEWITLTLMKAAVGVLANDIQYVVPEQDLEIPLSQVPTVPNSHFIMRNINMRNNVRSS